MEAMDEDRTEPRENGISVEAATHTVYVHNLFEKLQLEGTWKMEGQ